MADDELEALAMRFFRLMRALRQHFARDLARHGLTFPQFMALLSLEKAEGPCRMGPLAAATLQSLPSMTGIVDRLVERGLVERRRDLHDRRSVVVSLTETGVQLLHQIKAERHRKLEQVLSTLSAEERTHLHAAVDRIIEALESGEAQPAVKEWV
ncbi:MAG: MarR family transcriptional regulator [Anaerolineae bacterium]|nr:MarR family transcriptional regulator [Anaerolineae bacterium]